MYGTTGVTREEHRFFCPLSFHTAIYYVHVPTTLIYVRGSRSWSVGQREKGEEETIAVESPRELDLNDF